MNPAYDVVIIGTGVAGALIAWKLSVEGAKVLMLDCGEKRIEKSDRDQFVEVFAKLAQKDRAPVRPYTRIDADNGRFSHSPDTEDFVKPGTPDTYYQQVGPDLFKSQYARFVGGTTLVWRGNCPRNIPNDFKLWTQYKRGVDWPICYDDLEPFYCEAEEALGVAGDDNEWGAITKRSKSFPMPKIAQAYGDQRLIQALGVTSFGGKEIRILGLPQARNSMPYDGRPACEGNNNCIPICPIQAKYDATVHVRKALQQGVTLIERAVITELTLEGDKIGGVSYKSWDGQNHSVAGRVVVLAANAIESAKILLLSNNRAGIANTSKQVGLNLMDHIGGEGAALMPFATFPFRGPQSTSCIEAFRDHSDRGTFSGIRLTIGNDGWGRGKHPYQSLKELTSGDPKDPGSKQVFGAELREKLFETVSHQMRVAYTLEQLPIPENRVVLSATENDGLGIPKPQIAYKVDDDYTLKGAAHAQEIIKHIFRTVKAPEKTWEFSDLTKRVYSGSGHIMGTLRMAESGDKGVVDAECRSFDHKNLFVAGASVFATGAPTNPTITVAALALRTAKAIERQLAGR